MSGRVGLKINAKKEFRLRRKKIFEASRRPYKDLNETYVYPAV